MNGLLKSLQAILIFLVLAALCLSIVTIPSCSGLIRDVSTPPEGDDDIPSTGTCANVGEVYPDNPFSGWPVQGGASWGQVTAYYCDPGYFEQFGVHHFGIDLGYSTGTPVIATSNGNVSASGFHSEMGLYVRICENDWCATYMHLSSLNISTGQAVSDGQVLGQVGNTGNSTGPHLHYQINDPDWNTVDPAPTI